MLSVASQKRHPLSADFSRGTGKNQQDPGHERYSSFVTLFFAEILLMKIFRCAGSFS